MLIARTGDLIRDDAYIYPRHTVICSKLIDISTVSCLHKISYSRVGIDQSVIFCPIYIQVVALPVLAFP